MSIEEKNIERITISIPSDLNASFEEIRKKLNMNRSDAIRKAMRLYIDHESEIVSKEKEFNFLGTITYLERKHIHAHLLKENDHNHHNEYNQKQKEKETYYIPIEQYEYVRATELEHQFTDIIISTTHIHVNPEECMLIITVRGNNYRIKSLIDQLSGFKTIENIQLTIIKKSEAI